AGLAFLRLLQPVGDDVGVIELVGLLVLGDGLIVALGDQGLLRLVQGCQVSLLLLLRLGLGLLLAGLLLGQPAFKLGLGLLALLLRGGARPALFGLSEQAIDLLGAVQVAGGPERDQGGVELLLGELLLGLGDQPVGLRLVTGLALHAPGRFFGPSAGALL